MIKNYAKYTIVIIILLLSLIIKFYAQNLGLTGLSYSDITHGLFSTRFVWIDNDKWFNQNVIDALVNGDKNCPLVYKDYFFEYPPVIGFLWQFTTCLSIQLSFPNEYFSTEYQVYIERASSINFIVNVFVLGITFVLLIYVLERRINIDYKKLLWLVLSPSVFLYLFYNWDVLCIFFYAISIYFYSGKKYFKAGVFIGLSVSTKLLTLIPALIYLIDSMKHRYSFAKFVMGFIIGMLPFVFFLVYSPSGFWAFIQYHGSWYCENCLYALLIEDIFSQLHRLLFIFTEGLVIILSIIMYLKHDDLHRIGFYSFLGTISLSYIFTPQMLLMLIPLALINLNHNEYRLFFISDFLNALIIPIFFAELSSGVSPWNIGSLTQTLAQFRNLILLFLYIHGLMKLMSYSK